MTFQRVNNTLILLNIFNLTLKIFFLDLRYPLVIIKNPIKNAHFIKFSPTQNPGLGTCSAALFMMFALIHLTGPTFTKCWPEVFLTNWGFGLGR